MRDLVTGPDESREARASRGTRRRLRGSRRSRSTRRSDRRPLPRRGAAARRCGGRVSLVRESSAARWPPGVCASSRTARRSRSRSAMRVTSPSEVASAASISRPVNSRSFVRAGPTRSTSRAQIGRRQAVAERPRDRHAELRRGRADAQIAGQRDHAAAAGGDAVDLRDGRRRDALEPVDDRVQPPLVGDPVLAGGERR